MTKTELIDENLYINVIQTDIEYNDFKVFIIKSNYLVSHSDIVDKLIIDDVKINYNLIHLHLFCFGYEQYLGTVLIHKSYLKMEDM